MEKRGIEWLWESGALGDTDPETLQYTLVVDSNTHGNTGRDKHHKLRFGDFTVKSTTSTWSFQLDKKWETEKCTNANARSFKLKK